jgi:hypothetical protein
MRVGSFETLLVGGSSSQALILRGGQRWRASPKAPRLRAAATVQQAPSCCEHCLTLPAACNASANVFLRSLDCGS